MKQVIYETKGRAREFNELALNLYSGCGHGCIYCYGADVTHQGKSEFKNNPQPRMSLYDIGRSATEYAGQGEKRSILLCFVTDPYQPLDVEMKLTRNAIRILKQHGLRVTVLTKGGQRSTRDFDLLGPEDAYATTLTLTSTRDSLYWEPAAAPPWERIEALKIAHAHGIGTWVSFEPVIYPRETFKLLDMTTEFVGHYKVGTMNYHPQGRTVDWRQFGWNIKRALDAAGAKYYFKRGLLKEMGVNPEEFPQTWVCH